MSGSQAVALQLSPLQQALLQRLVRRQTADQRLVRRASILLALIAQLLADAPRPGAPPTFTPEQIVQLVAVACEPPEQSGRPIDHWTARELADEVKKRHLVTNIR